jgi:UDP-N-acetylmuramate--alanine ligase
VNDLVQPVHFIGIGGAGMSAIARILLARGYAVSGSDAKDSVALAALKVLGATTHVGHSAEQVHGAGSVVVSTAIGDTNEEVVEAGRLGLPVLRRAEALAQTMTGHRVVAVAGTHGKTTTTSMLTVAVQACGEDPSFAIGGSLNESGVNAHNGSGDLFIAEADESDGTFLVFSPDLAIVTNVEPDHLDHYGSPAAVEDAFEKMLDRIRPGGTLVVAADDPGAVRIAERAVGRDFMTVTFGESAEADLRIESLHLLPLGSEWTPVFKGRRLPTLRLRVPGQHNALNAAAALAAGLALGLPDGELREGLSAFSGTRRRFEPKGNTAGVRVFDDYAHHPTEVAATLAAARRAAGDGRVVAVFQPHRFSRTAAFRGDFARALAAADEVVVMEVYAAGEEAIPGASGAAVAAEVPLPSDRVAFEPSWSAVPAVVAARCRPGDLVLTMGAGDVTMIGPEILRLLADPGVGVS